MVHVPQYHSAASIDDTQLICSFDGLDLVGSASIARAQ